MKQKSAEQHDNKFNQKFFHHQIDVFAYLKTQQKQKKINSAGFFMYFVVFCGKFVESPSE